MKHSKKVCTHDKVIVALNADKDKYSNYETTTCDKTIGKVCVRCQDRERLEFFGVPKRFDSTGCEYASDTSEDNNTQRECKHKAIS